MSNANRPRATQRTSDVKNSFTVRTSRRAVSMSKAIGCSLIPSLAVAGQKPLMYRKGSTSLERLYVFEQIDEGGLSGCQTPIDIKPNALFGIPAPDPAA